MHRHMRVHTLTTAPPCFLKKKNEEEEELEEEDECKEEDLTFVKHNTQKRSPITLYHYK